MAKEGFLIYTGLYASVREFLTLEQRGMLLDALHDFQESGIEPDKASPIAMAFAIYKNQFRLDNAKHQKRAEKARENGLKGGRPTKSNETQLNPENPVGYFETEKTQTVISKPSESYKEKEKEKEKDKDKDKENTLESVREFQSFDACKAAREFEEIYKKAGRRNAIEREYAQALQKIKQSYGYDFQKGHDSIKIAAAAYMTFTVKMGTEFRYMPNPETWLAERMYETNWIEKAKESRTENPNEPKPRQLIGLTKVLELERQSEERRRKALEEEANGH